ncbi:unnamed protein product [Prorocentrum cordatum]|uniref:40S ribosomal protein S25 n=1 Tax=Prorocentrum cordatum TaxID=2364126 RepID=A0ABN9UQ39_9DINO|nr:unnamed protein product [Polarella glacialis]
MAPKAKKDDKKKGKTVAVTSKKAEEARKKELVQGEGAGRLKVLESLHCTGVLTSRPASRDVRIEQVTMSIYGLPAQRPPRQ